MKRIFMLVILCLIATAMLAEEEGDPRLMALQGEYIALGIAPHSLKPYKGKIMKFLAKDTLSVIRIINGKKSMGKGRLEKNPPSEITEFVVNFQDGRKTVRAVYLMQSEYDNYIRLTGMLYSKGVSLEKKGLEALFPVIN